MVSPALIAAALAALAPAGPQTPMAVAQRFTGDYKKAMLAKDVTYFDHRSTADFTNVDKKGVKWDKAASLVNLKTVFGMIQKYKLLDQKIVSARRAEGGIVFVTDRHVDVILDMGGRTGNMVSKVRNETLVVPVGKDWNYKRVKVIAEETRIDGKLVG